MSESVNTAIVGSGITGLLVARELLRAGEEVTVIERGPLRLDADAQPLNEREPELPTTEHNTGPTPADGGHPWQYAYAFGGSSLLWSGVAPRLLPSDFETHTRFGIWRDWPIGYDDLLPFYREAEQALQISGREHELFPGSDAYPLPPPEPSTADRLLGPLLEPFGALPLARPAAGSGTYPPPLSDAMATADASSTVSSVEPSSTILGVARELAASPGFTVQDSTAAARLRADSSRVTSIECLGANGERREIRANRVVLAANGIENAALLLRSGITTPEPGRRLGDHVHVLLHLELGSPLEDRRASSRDTGISYAWAEGDWRSERASAVVIPFNPGLLVRDELAAAIADGEKDGKSLRERMSVRFARTLVVYVSLEDAPREDRFVELSSRRDGLGLPRSRVRYPPDSEYVRRGLESVRRGLEERLAPLDARVTEAGPGGMGGHMLGACAMGADGVVDENLRHHRLGNLYVAGGSAFPTHSALHPTTTIAALALRLGRHLAVESR